jgi:hypothetical protein
MSTNHQQLLLDYNEGRRSIQEVLHAVQSYRGPEPHCLWGELPLPNSAREFVFEHCLRHLSEERLFGLVRALIRANPRFPAITRRGKSFLKVALWHRPVVPSRVILLLAVPEATHATRRTDTDGDTPLNMACMLPREDPRVIIRLMDHDPDALMLPCLGRVPLHHAIITNSTSPAVARMAHERPESLLCRDPSGRTPVEDALLYAPRSPQLVATLRELVALRPRSVVPDFVPGRADTTALHSACQRFHEDPDLLLDIVRAHPPALCIAASRGGRGRELPFETPTFLRLGSVPAFVAEETVHMALAVVEYVLEADAAFVAAAADEDEDDASWFRGHVRETVQGLHRDGTRVRTSSGLAVAQAVRTQDDHPVGAIRAMFCHERAARLLLRGGSGRDRKWVITGETVLDLYKLNGMGRLGDMSASHQVNLLASLKGSDNVESTYLHFREVASHFLLTRGGSRNGRRCRRFGD